MSLRRRKLKAIPDTHSDYNNTSERNPSQFVDEKTNFTLRTITYEDIDKAVYDTFDKRFAIRGRTLTVIQLDSPIPSQFHDNPIHSSSTDEKWLSFPLVTLWRSNNKKSNFYRSSPLYKPIIYAIPKMKPQGVVYEEWIVPVSRRETLVYQIKFMSTYRDSTNEFEKQINEYFKNKRNVIESDGERWEIYPESPETIVELEVVNRDTLDAETVYVSTVIMNVEAYFRDADQVQKRERANRISLQMKEITDPKTRNLDRPVDIK